MKIEKKIFTEREKIIDSFYKEFFTWSAGNVGMWLAAGVFEFVAIVIFCFPYEEAQKENMLMFAVLLALAGAECYIAPYVSFQEFGKGMRISDKLQYLPVSVKELQGYRLKKLAVFCAKMFVVFFVGQMFFALVTTHTITLGNVGYVIIWGLLLPFVGAALLVKCSR